jgi:hypothetical protein
MLDGVSNAQMLEYERYRKHCKEFNAWRDRAIEQLPALAARIFKLRKSVYRGCGFHYSIEKTLGFLLWKLNDFEAYPLDIREMAAHRLIMKIHLNGLFKDVIKAEKEIAARMKI